MIPQSIVDRIMSAANIVDVINDFVTLKKAGSGYKGLCPFHDDSTPSMSVSPSKGIFKCFACGEAGNVAHFVMKHEQISYVEALKYLAKKYGIEVPDRELTPEEKMAETVRESMSVLNEWACNYFHNLLLNDADGQAIGLTYFRSRGFRDDIIEKFRLGYCLDKNDALAKKALKEGYKAEFLTKTGLCIQREDGSLRDKYYGRVMFPWFSVSGKIIGFGGRVLDARTKGVSQKYINSPSSEIYDKSKELYGLFQAKKEISKQGFVYMVEGYTDVISMHQCGIENVVANSGTALTEEQISLLKRYTQTIVMLYDGDNAGIKAANRGIDMVLEKGMSVYVVLIPDGDDPDSFARKHNATEFQEFMKGHQTDFITFKTSLLLQQANNDPIQRAELIKGITSTIALVPNEITRSVYIHQCSELMNMKEDVLLNQVNQTRKKTREEKQRRQEAALNSQNSEQNSDEAGSNNPPLPTSPEAGNVQGNGNVRKANQSKLVGLEQLIMTSIVRYGERQYSFDGANPMSVIDYLVTELNKDGIRFKSPLYQKMLDEIAMADKTDGFVAANYFMNSQDMEISTETAGMITDGYDIVSSDGQSQDEASGGRNVTRLVLDYKNALVEEELSEIMKKMADKSLPKDACMNLLQRQMQLTKIRRNLALLLGERICK